MTNWYQSLRFEYLGTVGRIRALGFKPLHKFSHENHIFSFIVCLCDILDHNMSIL